jgi:CBS domain-containing protein
VIRILAQDIMTRKPLACSTTDNAREVARLMRDKGVGFVVVLRAGKVAGILTDRQLAVRVLAEEIDPRDVKAQDVMTHDPVAVRPDDDLPRVLEAMRGAGVVRRVPVVNANDELVGVVSISDISVVGKDILDAVMLEETRHALTEVRVPSGGKAAKQRARASGLL